MIEMHAKIMGNVHGVGFRMTTHTFASRLGLTGSVRNASDGSVEITAQGEKEDLENLLSQLKNAFGDLYIEKMDIKFSECKTTYKDFSIST